MTACTYMPAGDLISGAFSIGESVRYAPAGEIGVGLIRELIGVADEAYGSARIVATISFVASDGAECEQRFKWQLDAPDYALLGEWLDAAHACAAVPDVGWSPRHAIRGTTSA